MTKIFKLITQIAIAVGTMIGLNTQAGAAARECTVGSYRYNGNITTCNTPFLRVGSRETFRISGQVNIADKIDWETYARFSLTDSRGALVWLLRFDTCQKIDKCQVFRMSNDIINAATPVFYRGELSGFYAKHPRSYATVKVFTVPKK